MHWGMASLQEDLTMAKTFDVSPEEMATYLVVHNKLLAGRVIDEIARKTTELDALAQKSFGAEAKAAVSDLKARVNLLVPTKAAIIDDKPQQPKV